MNKKWKFTSFVLASALFCGVAGTTFVGCKDYDDDINRLQEQVDANKKSIDDILAKIKAGQYVQSVEKTANGVKVTLGDGSFVEILNGKDGATGAAGQDGAPGKAATIEISEDGYWVINGEKTNNLARGEKGETGAQGPQGETGDTGLPGKSAYDVAKENGFVGTEAEWVASLQGKDGKSAYELAKEAGFEGDLNAWIESLKVKGNDGLSAYEIYKKNLSEGTTPMTETEWLESLKVKGEAGVAPRINEAGNWEVFDNATGKWTETDPVVNAKGTDLYVTETTTGNGWILYVKSKDAEGNFSEDYEQIFLPKAPASGLSLVYQPQSSQADAPEKIISVYDENEMLIAGTTNIKFKLFGNGIDENKNNFKYFYDLYVATKSKTAEPTLIITGKPEITSKEGYYILDVETSASNLANGQIYKASLNAEYSSQTNGTAASGYFNVQAKTIQKSDIHAILETAKSTYAKLTQATTIEFVYTGSLVLSDTIFPGYTDNNVETLLNIKGVLPEFKIVEKSESAAFFTLSEDGMTVSAGNKENAPSAAINYTCGMTVRYYIMKNNEKVYLTDAQAFEVKAIQSTKPLPTSVTMYNLADGSSKIKLGWSNTTSSTVRIDLHKATTSLYSQLNGRDNFIANCTDGKTATYYIYALGENNKYAKVDGVSLTWTVKGTKGSLADSLNVTVEKNVIIPEGDYYVSSNDKYNEEQIPMFTDKCRVPVTINLNVDLQGKVISNPYYVENGKVTIRGQFTAPATVGASDGKHEMTADLSKVFTVEPELDLTYTLADEQDAAIADLIDSKNLVLTNGVITLTGDNFDPDVLPKVNIVVSPVGYTGSEVLENGNAELVFRNPIDKESIAYKEVKDILETAEHPVFDLSGIILTLKDIKGHDIIKNGEIVATDKDKTTNWGKTYGITAVPKLTEKDIIIPSDVKDAFKFDEANQTLTYDNSAMVLTKDIEITVKPKVKTSWGTFSASKAKTFKVLKKK